MAKLILMVGVPGSGKTTTANNLKTTFDAEVISSDKLRDMHPDWQESLIFPEAYRLSIENLKNGQSVIFDATNITPQVRKTVIDAIIPNVKEKVGIEAICVISDLKEIKKRIAVRNKNPNERFFPIYVANKYYNDLVIPTYDEGFDNIMVINNDYKVED